MPARKESFRITDPPRRFEGLLLASVGGCVDAVGVVLLGGLFVSHMSGNTAEVGALMGQGDWFRLLPHLMVIPIFLLGLFLGYVAMLHSPTFKRCGKVLLGEAILLASFGLIVAWVGPPSSDQLQYYFIVALPVLAMGIQNSTLREVQRALFASTYVTGVLDALGKALARVFLLRTTKKSEEREESQRTARQAFGVWLSYVVGAVAGSVGILYFRYAVITLPVAVLLVLSWRFFQIKDQPRPARAA